MGVAGIESFREMFKDYPDCYTIIGGAACDILMTDEERPFRATRDIDMILLLEDRFTDFAETFWRYIKEGGYQCGWKNSDDVHFYRFTDPKPGYPVQIELFSRMPDYHLETDNGIIPIHIDDDVSSLSAILLNDDFYDYMMKGRIVLDGLSILSAAYIIPFKMFAWLNLKERKEAGEHVNSRDLKKHKNDVYRLLQIVPVGTSISVDGMVGDTVKRFLDDMTIEEVSFQSLGVEFSKGEAMALLREIYSV